MELIKIVDTSVIHVLCFIFVVIILIGCIIASAGSVGCSKSQFEHNDAKEYIFLIVMGFILMGVGFASFYYTINLKGYKFETSIKDEPKTIVVDKEAHDMLLNKIFNGDYEAKLYIEDKVQDCYISKDVKLKKEDSDKYSVTYIKHNLDEKELPFLFELFSETYIEKPYFELTEIKYINALYKR